VTSRRGLLVGTAAAVVGVAGTATGPSVRSAAASQEPSQEQGPPTDLYLLIGQSNMAGRAPIEDTDTPAPEGVFLFDSDGGWEPAVNEPYGLNRCSTVRKELAIQQLNPGRTFGARLAELTGRGIGLVVNARGGTTIAQWRPIDHDGDIPLYDEAMARAASALEVTPGARLAGVIWHQGEGDNNADAENYYLPTLADIVTGLRTELAAEDAVFVAGEVGTWQGRGAYINPLIRQVPDVIERSGWVSSDGLTSVDAPNNDPHFDAVSQRVLGRRYADEVLRLGT
jgi:hypothetical protein